VINAGAGNDIFNLNPSVIAGLTQLEMFGQAGDDTFNIHPSASAEVIADGGAHAVSGDRLNIEGDALEYDFDNASFSTPTRRDVNYIAIETLGLEDGVFEAVGVVTPDVEVDSAATLIGEATITGSVSVLVDGTIAPGSTYPVSTGILDTGDLSFTAGATYSVDLNGLVAGTEHDQLNVTGTVNLNNGDLTGTAGVAFVPGDELVIIHNDGNDPVIGTFAQGALVTIGGQEFAVDYAHDADGDGNFNDVALIKFGAALAPDPCDPAKEALFVSASTGNDDIELVSVNGNSLIQVLINGADEGTFSPTGLLIVFGQSGDDNITVDVPSRESWLYGQGGDDVLRAGNNDAVLNGGDGNDDLTAGSGKDILIGGHGADTANGGNGSDLLIGGWTSYENNNAANREAICAIQDEWTHGPGGWKGHIDHLSNGGGLNGTTVLNSTSVFDDASSDLLHGAHGNDWFLLNTSGGTALDSSDADKNEVLTDI
jgi:Ca2+-binding RTX toxin-like protein